MPAGGYGGKARLDLLEGFKTKLTLRHRTLKSIKPVTA